MQMKNLRHITLLGLMFFSMLLFAQNSPCKIKPSFKTIPNKALAEGFTVPTLDYVDNYKEILKEAGTSRAVVFHFFFDEKNKFQKTAGDFVTFLKDSLSGLKTDISINFKVQKTQGSIFFKDGNTTQSIIHLNALVYATDKALLNELFGKGKNVRIDTVSSATRKFTHEFVELKSVNNRENGNMFLFRAKLTGKGFACDPKEDVNILAILKKIYSGNFDKECQARLEEENKMQVSKKLDSLATALNRVNEELVDLQKRLMRSPNWSLFSHIDYVTGTVRQESSFTNSSLMFNARGLSSSAGASYFFNGTLTPGLFLTTGLNLGLASYSLSGPLEHVYSEAMNGYESIVTLKSYRESIASNWVNASLGLGYQYRDREWPIYFQISAGAIFGGNKLSSSGAEGIIDYQRSYPELPGVLVENQSSLALANDVLITGMPAYATSTALNFGYFANLKVNYLFSRTSPLTGFLNFGYIGASTKTTSNNTRFVSTEMGELNSLLNSLSGLRSVPFQIGVGISYELRNVINPSKK
jgi:hypothetical protein